MQLGNSQTRRQSQTHTSDGMQAVADSRTIECREDILVIGFVYAHAPIDDYKIKQTRLPIRKHSNCKLVRRDRIVRVLYGVIKQVQQQNVHIEWVSNNRFKSPDVILEVDAQRMFASDVVSQTLHAVSEDAIDAYRLKMGLYRATAQPCPLYRVPHDLIQKL
jgi:ribosomal protein L36